MSHSRGDRVYVEDVTDDFASLTRARASNATRVRGVPASNSASVSNGSSSYVPLHRSTTLDRSASRAHQKTYDAVGSASRGFTYVASAESDTTSGEMTFMEELATRRRASGAAGASVSAEKKDSLRIREAEAHVAERNDGGGRDFAASFRSIERLATMRDVGQAAHDGATPKVSPVKSVASPEESPAKSSEGSFAFRNAGGFFGQGSKSPPEVASLPPRTPSRADKSEREEFVSPTSSATPTPVKAPWTPSPMRTPLGTRIPPNSPASARTRRNLEAQMRRAAAWAAGEDTLAQRGDRDKGVSKLFEAKHGLGAKLFRLLVAGGHVKAFLKTLDSARIEKAHGGGAKLAIVALATNCGIQAAHNMILAISSKIGQKLLRRISVPQAMARRAAPLLLPATLASMGRSNAVGARGAISEVAAIVVPPLSLISFIGAMWPIPGGQLAGEVREHRGMLYHEVFLDALPWVNGFFRRLQPVTNALAIMASYELVSTGEVYAENGGFALALASILSFAATPPSNKVTVNFREVKATTNMVFLLSMSYAECAWRETTVWRQYLNKRQGGLEGVHGVDRERGGALAGIGGFTRAASRLPLLRGVSKGKRDDTRGRRRDGRRRIPDKRSTRKHRSVESEAPDGLVERALERLPVLGPVLIILSGFVF